MKVKFVPSKVRDGLLRTKNLLHVNAPVTFLTTLGTSGQKALNLKNTAGFAANDAIQIGETGEEQTEVKLLGTDALATTAGTTTVNLDFEHPADTPVYCLRWDQVEFQVSTTGTTGSATAITDGTVTYQPNAPETVFRYTSHASADAYKAKYISSLGTAVTGDATVSDWLPSGGLDFYTLGKIKQRIQQNLPSGTFPEETISDWINEYKDRMVNAVISVNEDYALGTADFAFSSAGLGTITNTDFKDVRRFEITYNGSDFYLSTKMNINDYLPDQTFSSTHPYHAWQGDTVFRIKPEESGGSARIVFYRFGTTMVNETDTLPQPMRSYTDGFVNFGLAQALQKDEKDHTAKLGEAEVAVGRFVDEVSARDKSGVSYIDIVEPLTGD